MPLTPFAAGENHEIEATAPGLWDSWPRACDIELWTLQLRYQYGSKSPALVTVYRRNFLNHNGREKAAKSSASSSTKTVLEDIMDLNERVGLGSRNEANRVFHTNKLIERACVIVVKSDGGVDISKIGEAGKVKGEEEDYDFDSIP
jgi:hypothetical protein